MTQRSLAGLVLTALLTSCGGVTDLGTLRESAPPADAQVVVPEAQTIDVAAPPVDQGAPPLDQGAPDTGVVPCPTLCAGACVDLELDPKNCGSCGHACGQGLVCANAKCAVTCGPGLTPCDGTSGTYCTNTMTDTANCGGCGKTCAAGLVCQLGQCAIYCPADQVQCVQSCIDPKSSNRYCGATAGCGADGGTAGTVCPAGRLCSNGVCTATCSAGTVECAGKCIDPMTSESFCGATPGCGVSGGSAGTACATGWACNGGVCVLSCQSDLIACSGKCIDPLTSTDHCGAEQGCGISGGSAGTDCGTDNACVAGRCLPLSCSTMTLTTRYASNNSQNGNMFDVVALKDVVLHSLNINLRAATATIEIYWRNGTWVGHDKANAGWTRAASVSVASAGADEATLVPVDLGLSLLAGQRYALYVTATSGQIGYSNGLSVGTIAASDSSLQILEGAGIEYPFAYTYQPRIWNGTLRYDACPHP